MGEILARVTQDQVGFSEDKAYKAHSMISPAMVEDFLVPAYNLWIPEITASGCQVIFMDSDGFIGELIPIWIDVGINVCGPIEVDSGNDILAFRETLGIRWPIRVGSTNTRSQPARILCQRKSYAWCRLYSNGEGVCRVVIMVSLLIFRGRILWLIRVC